MAEINVEAFKTNLNTLVEGRGMLFRDVAHAVGMTPATLSRYANGFRSPELSNILALADYFKVSVDWLIGRSNDRYASTIPEIQEIIDCYSKASEEDRKVIDVVLAKYKDK